jgi:hypothetical protein
MWADQSSCYISYWIRFFLIEDTYLLCLNNSTNDLDGLLLANDTRSKTRLDNQFFSKCDSVWLIDVFSKCKQLRKIFKKDNW